MRVRFTGRGGSGSRRSPVVGGVVMGLRGMVIRLNRAALAAAAVVGGVR